MALTALCLCTVVVWKIGGLKSKFIEERGDRVRQVLSEVGRVETMREANIRSSAIVEVMRRHGVAGLIVPLSSGGRVKFRISDSTLKIERG
jgi:hypothetical protein